MYRRILSYILRSSHSHLRTFTSLRSLSGILGSTYGQLRSTNSAGDDFTAVKIVQSISKVLMMNDDKMTSKKVLWQKGMGI